MKMGVTFMLTGRGGFLSQWFGLLAMIGWDCSAFSTGPTLLVPGQLGWKVFPPALYHMGRVTAVKAGGDFTLHHFRATQNGLKINESKEVALRQLLCLWLFLKEKEQSQTAFIFS